VKIRVVIIALLIVPMAPVSANGNLHTLIIELENVKGLVAQQQRNAENDGSRWVFRYDVLGQRIDELIADINKHIEVVNQSPKLERFK